MKKITCPGCDTIYRIPEEKIPKGGARLKCKKCGTLIGIANPGSIDNKDEVNIKESREISYKDKTPKTKYRDTSVLQRREDAKGWDSLSLTVFVLAIIALLFVGYMGYKSISKQVRYVSIKQISQKIVDTYLKEFTTQPRKRRYGSPEEERYFSYLNRGHKFYRKRDYDRALRFYDIAIKYKPKRYEAYYWRGQLLATKGDTDRAIDDMKQVIRLNPKSVSAYNYLGWIYSNSEQWNMAIEYLTKAIELNPKNGWAYYNRGRCYYKLGQKKKALQDAKKACDLGYKRGCNIYKQLTK